MRELYDLVADPGEENDIIESEPKLAAELDRQLETWIAEKLTSVGKIKDPVREEGAVNYALWKGVKATVA